MLRITWGGLDTPSYHFFKTPVRTQSASQPSNSVVEFQKIAYPLLIEWGPLESVPHQEIASEIEKIVPVALAPFPVSPPQETELEDPGYIQNASTPMKVLYETPVVTPIALDPLEDEETKQLRIFQLIESRRLEVENLAERNAQSAHAQRLRKKRTLTESIDECLVGHATMHEKATGLRLAFEHEASEWHNRVKSVARDLRTDLSEDLFAPPVPFQYSFEQEDWGDCQHGQYGDLMEVIANTSTSDLELQGRVDMPMWVSSSRSHLPTVAAAAEFVSTPKRMKKFMSPKKEASELD